MTAHEIEAEALREAARTERELAAALRPDSPIRGLFLRNAAAYELAADGKRRLEAVT